MSAFRDHERHLGSPFAKAAGKDPVAYAMTMKPIPAIDATGNNPISQKNVNDVAHHLQATNQALAALSNMKTQASAPRHNGSGKVGAEILKGFALEGVGIALGLPFALPLAFQMATGATGFGKDPNTRHGPAALGRSSKGTNAQEYEASSFATESDQRRGVAAPAHGKKRGAGFAPPPQPLAPRSMHAGYTQNDMGAEKIRHRLARAARDYERMATSIEMAEIKPGAVPYDHKVTRDGEIHLRRGHDLSVEEMGIDTRALHGVQTRSFKPAYAHTLKTPAPAPAFA